MSLALPAEIVHANASAVLGPLLAKIERASDAPVIDAQALVRFDSSALAVLLACQRAALARGRRLAVAGMPPRLRSLVEVYGLSELLA
jgi:phospholipid transport system transporter-binding protein